MVLRETIEVIGGGIVEKRIWVGGDRGGGIQLTRQCSGLTGDRCCVSSPLQPLTFGVSWLRSKTLHS
ncbi:MAG: hypothetical protein KME57_35030 [Scytonema hyalinum WJT4-NPBG1]|nr:hypothetical protein [Scytonema hyalinum WJT4-NPBG1]